MKQITLLLFSLLLFSCAEKKTSEKMVSVTIEPQRYFAEKIAGDKYTINCVVPAGQSPETYDPTPQQMIKVGQSVAYLKIGYIGFETAWMDNIVKNNPNLKVFDLSEGIAVIDNPDAEMHEEHDHEGEEHGHDHGHKHTGIDPHTWSSVAGAKAVAWNTLQAFIALDKENTKFYFDNYNALLAEIEKTEATINQLLEGLSNRTFIIYHPALSYFAAEYQLTQLCIEMDGKEPSPAQLKELVDTARANNTRVVFIQQEFDQKNAELIARETGCKLVRINPLSYNWHEEMILIAQSLKDAEVN